MPAAFGDADLIVCRSGAGAVSELAAAGKPSILSPFPFAADDHQTRNAEAMERGGAARLVRDAEMNGEKLFSLVSELEADPAALARMGQAARQFAHPGAARRAAEILEGSGDGDLDSPRRRGGAEEARRRQEKFGFLCAASVFSASPR